MNELKAKGLLELLSQYEADGLWTTETVAAVLSDLASGMELTTVAKRHRVPTDVVVLWAGSRSSVTAGSTSEFDSSYQSFEPDAAESALQLCERQLEYNTKTYREREDLARREFERLAAELAIAHDSRGESIISALK